MIRILISRASGGYTHSSSTLLHPLLYLLLDQRRFQLVGPILAACCSGVTGASISSVDWSDWELCSHLPESQEILETQLIDWLEWAVLPKTRDDLARLSLDGLKKVNLSNNALSVFPMCLMTQLPQLQVINMHIVIPLFLPIFFPYLSHLILRVLVCHPSPVSYILSSPYSPPSSISAILIRLTFLSACPI